MAPAANNRTGSKPICPIKKIRDVLECANMVKKAQFCRKKTKRWPETAALISALIANCLAWPPRQVEALTNRSLTVSKADQAKGQPSVYAPPKISHHFRQFSRYISMSDGTKIAVEVYLPKGLKNGEKIPTMFEQSRYWRVIKPRFPLNHIYSKPLSLYRSEFLSHGYAWVVSDARGAGASFGDRPWELPPIDVSDSKTILDWIVAQPWSDGKIGLIGHSYSGNMAEFSLISRHPAVKGAAVLSSAFDLYSDVLRPGGLPLQPFIDQWTSLNQHFDSNKLPKNLSFLRPLVSGMKNVDGDTDHRLLNEALMQHESNSKLNTNKINFRDDVVFSADVKHTATHEICLAMLKDWNGNQVAAPGVDLSSPSSYWRKIDACGVPIYAGAGWLDGGNANAAIKRFINYSTPGTKLILGPWDHNFINISPFTRGGFSRFRIDREMLKFFDHYLKGVSSLDADQPVHYYTLGKEQWRSSKTWPPSSDPELFYLSDRHLLQSSPPDSGGALHYSVDAKTGSGHHGRWDCLLGNILLDPYPDRKEQDKLLLVLQSPALKAAMTTSGSPGAKLYIKANAADCSLFVYLEDVWPDGSVHYVTEGEVLCGNRFNSTAQPAYRSTAPVRTFLRADYCPLDPGKVTEIDLQLLPISYQFKKGHKIRLAIAGQDKDHFQQPSFTETARDFTVMYGSIYPSQIVLPVEFD